MLHKLSLLMTGLIMMMGAAWFGLHTYGAPEPDGDKPQDIDVAETGSSPAAAMQTAEREETRDTSEEDKKAALLVARAKLNAQLIADAAPITAAVVETVASAAKPAEPKPVAVKPVAAKPVAVKPAEPKVEPRKPTPVAAKKEAAPPPAAKPAAAKPAPSKPDAAKPKSIDDILDSLD
jgi:hypothetical protein